MRIRTAEAMNSVSATGASAIASPPPPMIPTRLSALAAAPGSIVA